MDTDPRRQTLSYFLFVESVHLHLVNVVIVSCTVTFTSRCAADDNNVRFDNEEYEKHN